MDFKVQSLLNFINIIIIQTIILFHIIIKFLIKITTILTIQVIKFIPNDDNSDIDTQQQNSNNSQQNYQPHQTTNNYQFNQTNIHIGDSSQDNDSDMSSTKQLKVST
eukprot:UN02729